MTQNDQSQLDEAYQHCLKARDKSYSPYSKYAVGCVLYDDKNKMHTGCNIETAHFKGNCAEATAIGHMIMAGGEKIKEIYVIGSSGDALCSPCGDCRQRIREFATPETRIYCFNESGKVLKEYSMNELLPDSFGPENIFDR